MAGVAAARAGALLALASLCSAQLGLAASVGLFDRLGAQGVAWLRLVWAALLLSAILTPARSRDRLEGLRPAGAGRSRFTRAGLLVCVVLGTAGAGMSLFLTSAIARLPLGTATALGFLGPLGVAVARGHGGGRRWPVLAAVGVVLLTEPWRGGGANDPAGIGFGLAAAGCWAAYILLTQRMGDEVPGLRGLTVTAPVAAVVATLVSGPAVWSNLTGPILLAGLGLAVLVPLLPAVLELLALRRLTAVAFGTLMSLEPAVGLVIGLVALHQVPGPAPLLGVAFVVAAGIGVERTG